MDKKRNMELLEGLSRNELKLVKYLAKRSDKNGIVILNVKNASSELGISEDKLRELARSLTRKGLISIETGQEARYLRVNENFQDVLTSNAFQALSRLKDLEGEVDNLYKTSRKLRELSKDLSMKLERLSKIVETVKGIVQTTCSKSLSNINEEFEMIKARRLIGELNEESYKHVEKIYTSASTLASEITKSMMNALQDSSELLESVKKVLGDHTKILNALLQEDLTKMRSHLQENFEVLEKMIKDIRERSG